ncbi:MAG: tetratricopeptide repeat protein [Deltaproteobacteria bacterium]|nr:tetratricopeptide repeat protein [Deltaproteobacteria bacterium]
MSRLLATLTLAVALFTSSAAYTSGALAQAPNVRRARALFVQGQQAYEAGDFAQAAEKMRAAWELFHTPALAFNVARVYERMSEYDPAIRFFRMYLHHGQPTDEERADVEARITALQEAKRRQRDQVFTVLPPSGDELTNEARTFFLRGVAMFNRGHFQAAMEAFTAAQRFAPLPEIFYNMAVAAERLHSLRDAMDYYREYLRVRPNAPDRGHVEREIARLRRERRH